MSAQELRGGILVVPVGATEQHGPHLPLTTDTDIACALAEALAAKLPGQIVVAPAIPFGASGEHQDFAGTLSIGRAATELLLIELGRSATCSWPRVLLLSTHGGNHTAVAAAVALLRNEGHDVCAWSPAWHGDAHAGSTETSLMLAICPGSVWLHLAEPGAHEPLTELLPRMRANGVAAVSPNGVIGDPTTASAGQGQRLIGLAVSALTDLIANWPTPRPS